jgi:PAS domain S-box-containing protein
MGNIEKSPKIKKSFALKECKTRFENIALIIADWIWEIDCNFRYVYASDKIKEFLGYEPEELTGKSLFDFISVEDIIKVKKYFTKITERKIVPDIENWKLKKDGKALCMVTKAVPLFDRNGNLTGFQGVDKDITANKLAENALKETEERYLSFLHNFQGIVFQRALDSKPLIFHGAIEEITGYKESEFITGNIIWDEIVHPEDVTILNDHNFENVQGYSSEAEYRIICKNGNIKWIRQIGHSICDENGTPGLVEGFLLDVTRRKNAEEAHRKIEEAYRMVVENANEGIIIAQDGIIKFINPKMLAISGFSLKEAVSRPFIEFIHPEDRPMVMKHHIKRTSREESPEKYDLRVIAKDGDVKWIENNGVIVEWEGRPATLNFISDITASKEAENAIIESRRRFEQVAENTGEMIWEVDADGIYTYCSSAVEKILGYTPEELVGQKHYYDMFAPDVREILKHAAIQAFKHREPFRNFVNPNTHKNGGIVILETSGAPVLDDNGVLLGYRGADMDITERKLAEEKLRNQMEFLTTLIDTIPNPLFYKDANGIYMGANKAFFEFTGKSPEEVVGKNVFDVSPEEFAVKYHKKDMELFDNPGKQSYEWKVKSKDNSVKNVIYNKATFNNSAGNVAGLLGIMIDITDRKRAEQEREDLIDELRKANSEIENLQGLIPICSFCKKIRDDEGYWEHIEKYISEHSKAIFSHGVCPDCIKKHYPEYSDEE